MAASIASQDTATSFRITEDEVERRAQIGVEARFLFDDNILRLDEREPTPAGRSRRDLRLTTSVVADLSGRVSLQRFYLRGAAGYDFYAENKFLERERINLEGGVDWRVTTRCDGNASIAYSRLQSGLDDIDLVIPNARDSRIVSLSGGCDIGLAFRPEVRYRHRASENSNPLLRERDLRTSLLGVSLNYARSELGSIGIAASEEVLLFPNRNLISALSPDRYTLRELRLNASRRIGDLRLNGSIGYAGIDSSARGGDEEEILAWSAGLLWAPSPRARVRLFGSRLIDATADVPAGYFIIRTFGFDITRRVGRALDLSAGFATADRTFRDTRPLQRTFDRTNLFRVGAAFRPWRPIRVEGELQFQSRDSDVVFGDYSSNRAILTVAAEF